MKIIKFITDNKKQILIGVFVGIFTYIFIFLSRVIGEKIVEQLLAVSERFSNQYYQSLSVFSPNRFDRLTYSLLVMAGSIVLVYFSIILVNRGKELKKQGNRLLEKLKLFDEDQKEVNNEIEGIKKKIEKLKEEMRTLPSFILRMKVGLITTNSIIILLFFGQYMYIESQYIQYNELQNKITAVSSHITNQEVLSFRSRFVLMKNAEDYDRLMHDLNGYLADLNLDI